MRRDPVSLIMKTNPLLKLQPESSVFVGRSTFEVINYKNVT